MRESWMLESILPEFQKFLTSRGIADEKHAPFYARWVSKFLAFSNIQFCWERGLAKGAGRNSPQTLF